MHAQHCPGGVFLQLSIDLALCRPKTDVLGSHHYHCNLSSENHLHKYWYFPKLPGNNSSICSLHTIVHPNLICELPKYKQDLRLLRYFRAADHQTLSATTEVHARLTATSVFPCCRPNKHSLPLPKYLQDWRLLRYFRAADQTNTLFHYRSICKIDGYFGNCTSPTINPNKKYRSISMFAVYFGISNQPDTLPADKPLHSKCQLPLTSITLLLPPHLSLN